MKKTLVIITLVFASELSFSQKSKPEIKSEPKIAQTQPKDTIFVLEGIRENFQFMKFALEHPGDVTPNQNSALEKWIDQMKPEASPFGEAKEEKK